MDKIREFEKDITLYWHCESRDEHAIPDLRRALQNEVHPVSLEDFSLLLDDAIGTQKYSVTAYENLTGLDFDSATEIVDDLKLLQKKLFGVPSAADTPEDNT